MRVCLANDSFPPLLDGVANAVVNYASVIQKNYGSAIVATPAYPGVRDQYSFPVLRYRSIDTTKMVGYRTGYPFSKSAMEKLVGFRPDLIHSHCPMASTFLCRELRELTNVPLVFTYHTKFDVDIKRAVKMKLLQESAIKALVKNISACDDVWAVNRGAGENLKSLGFQGSYTVMPNGVDIGRGPAPADALHSLNAQYSLPEGVPLFLFVGRMMWYKGLRIILEGLQKLQNAGTDFRMVFVGSGDDRIAAEQLAAELGIAERCLFVGAERDRQKLRLWYCRADMFLLPSVFDNNPLVVKEAAACATASVLVEGSSSAEGVTDGRNGALIRESSDSLFRALQALCAHPEAMRSMGERAADELYVSWEDSVACAMNRYRDVLKNYNRDEKRKKVFLDNSIELIGLVQKQLAKIDQRRQEKRDLIE